MVPRLILCLLLCLTLAPLPGASPLHVSLLHRDLAHPWGLVFLPGGDLLVSERPGRLLRLGADGRRHVVTGLPEIAAQGQGGLLDLALDDEGWLYFSYSEPGPGGSSTAVARARLQDERLISLQPLFSQRPKVSGGAHFGSRLVLGGDGLLYITLGDRYHQRDLAQRLDNHIGKTVRLNRDGSVPADNPFRHTQGALPEIWSLGHRNMQGAAWRPLANQFWTHEHGPQGGDEVNLILGGQNYGWPRVSFGEEYGGGKIGEGAAAPGLIPPLKVWVPSIAPSGMAFHSGARYPQWRDKLFVGALRGQSLRELTLAGDAIVGERTLLGERGERIRTVKEGPDGALYLLTDSGSGKLLRLTPLPLD
ncbi:PQQ-dependent sugar dehydrogenase [Aeromonas bivalvium]|uniref:PQQ-dependent sugar dehydrogenase n=1 Tax=Aeromonas bivalvium TaxID=440079 RepID=UPI0038D0AE01